MSSSDIISVEQVSKLYRLGEVGSRTLSHDLNQWWYRMRAKVDHQSFFPGFSKLSPNSAHDLVWSLKEVSFSVKQGEIFGVVGRNGAGKSTLLKLLSKITKPTAGQIKLDGRIASLLEVGTGFHPDLSGRENIFLNGAILGLKKSEIKARFDEILAFAGIERYIDTPVKRYSSGMFVRLAFAVAAHLDPEILIIDEVLAVGDAEFQKKCINKMQDVAGKEGRTILFVSHNVAAIKSLCHRVLFLEQGRTKHIGTVDEVLREYQLEESDLEVGVRSHLPEGQTAYFVGWHLEDNGISDLHTCVSGQIFSLVFEFKSAVSLFSCELNLKITLEDSTILFCNSSDHGGRPFMITAGRRRIRIKLQLPIAAGKYQIEVGLFDNSWVDVWRSTTRLTVLENYETKIHRLGSGLLRIKTEFSVEANS